MDDTELLTERITNPKKNMTVSSIRDFFLPITSFRNPVKQAEMRWLRTQLLASRIMVNKWELLCYTYPASTLCRNTEVLKIIFPRCKVCSVSNILCMRAIVLETMQDNAGGGHTGSLQETHTVYHKRAQELLLHRSLFIVSALLLLRFYAGHISSQCSCNWVVCLFGCTQVFIVWEQFPMIHLIPYSMGLLQWSQVVTSQLSYKRNNQC